MRRSLFVALTWLLVCPPSFAQTLGTITGEVRDSTGGMMPGATVTVVNKATNATRTTTTNEVGLFDFPALPPGIYSVKSELEGFKTASSDVELQVQQTARVNFKLELATLSETTTVTGVSPLVETSNATIGTVKRAVAWRTPRISPRGEKSSTRGAGGAGVCDVEAAVACAAAAMP